MCGRIKGRPLYEPMSAGILIIDKTSHQNKVYLVVDKNGLNDPGGKVDPDLDKSHYETVFREAYEELGILLNVPIFRLPYVELQTGSDTPQYRLYIVEHTLEHPAYLPSNNKMTWNYECLPVVRYPTNMLSKKHNKNISKRLIYLLSQKIFNQKRCVKTKITLGKILSKDNLHDLIRYG
jgi:hypothetical protein